MDDAKLDKLLKFENTAAAPTPEQALARIRTQRAAQEPRATHSSRVLLWTLFSLAALALGAILYLNSRPDSSSLPDNSAAACFADAADFRAKVRLAGIVGDTVLLEHLDTGKQQLFRKDDTLFDYKITRIGEGEVEFIHAKNAEDTFTLKLTGDGKPDVAKPADGSFMLQGTVFDFDGKPAPGAYVYAIVEPLPGRYYASTLADSTLSDSRGHYSIPGRQAISQIMVRLANGKQYVVDGAWKTSATVDLRAPRMITLSGTVKDQHGKTLPGVQMTFAPSNVSIRTNLNGEWSATVPAPATSVRCFATIAYRNYAVTHTGDWDADATIDLTLEIPVDYFILRGDVVLQDRYPLSDTLLEFHHGDPAATPYSAVLNDNGEFALLVPAYHTITSVAVRANALDSRTLLKGSWNNDTEIHIGSSDINELFSLCGTITGMDGKPAPGIIVTANAASQDQPSPRCYSNKDGRYALLCDAPVSELVTTTNGGSHVLRGDYKADAIADIDLRKTTSFLIQGRVLDAAGKPVAGAMVTAPELHYPRAVTDTAGDYQLRVFGGATVESLTVTAPGLFIAINVSIKADTTYDIDLSKEKLFTLRGTAKLDTGEPVAFAPVTAECASGEKTLAGTASTDSDGNYSFATNLAVKNLRLGWRGGHKKGPWSSDAVVDFITSVDKMTAE